MIFAAIADWADSKTYPVDFMCRELDVSRSGFYKWLAAEPSQRSKDDTVLILIMKKVFTESRGNPGVRRMRAGMAAIGYKMSTGKVHRLMKAAGLRGRHPKAWKKTTIHGEKPVDAPDRIGRVFTQYHLACVRQGCGLLFCRLGCRCRVDAARVGEADGGGPGMTGSLVGPAFHWEAVVACSFDHTRVAAVTNGVEVSFRGDLTDKAGVELSLVLRGKNRPGLRWCRGPIGRSG